MAKLALFEDDPSIIRLIGWLLEDSPHQVSESADTLSGAFDVLHRVLAQEVSVDLILLDGHLGGNSEAAEFPRPANNSPDRLVRSGFMGRHVEVVHAEQPAPITADQSFAGARDAQAIMDVIGVYGIDIPVIGISNDPLADTLKPHSQEELDFDLTKSHLVDLVKVVDNLV